MMPFQLGVPIALGWGASVSPTGGQSGYEEENGFELGRPIALEPALGQVPEQVRRPHGFQMERLPGTPTTSPAEWRQFMQRWTPPAAPMPAPTPTQAVPRRPTVPHGFQMERLPGTPTTSPAEWRQFMQRWTRPATPTGIVPPYLRRGGLPGIPGGLPAGGGGAIPFTGV